MAVRRDKHSAKRQRIEEPADSRSISRSRIFAPYRTLGLVSPTSVPFTSIPLGRTTFQITTSTGRSLHTYDLRRGLHLIFITKPQTPADITSTCAWKDRVFAAWGGGTAGDESGVWVFQRGKRTGELEIPAMRRESILSLLVFGSWIVGCGSSRVDVWKSSTYEHYTTILATMRQGAHRTDAFSGNVCNMPTLLNKVCVGKRDGSVDIWNIGTGRLVYSILPPSLECGSVTALQPTPALSLLGIARADGSIIIHDIRLDKEILRLNTKASAKAIITSISFRTDELGAGEDGRDAGVMATSGPDDGDVTLWDLNGGGRIMGILPNAHDPPSVPGGVPGGITRVEFLPGQALILTSGRDNSLKSWIFDEEPFSTVPRILHSRSGHAGSITRLDFLPVEADGNDAIGKWLLSAGRDQSLWSWSLRRDGQSTELSQGKIGKKSRKLGHLGSTLALDGRTSLNDLKAPEITCIACNLNRDGGMGASTGGGAVWSNISTKNSSKGSADNPVSGWESIVTGHRGDKFARTWFWGRRKAGRWAFETGDGTEVKSVAMSPCGTFALIGSAGGGIDMYNLQSGIHRQKFPSPISPAQARKLKLEQAEGKYSPTNHESGKYAKGQGRHSRDVTGIIVDSINRNVISCGLDGRIKFWDFATGTLHHEIDWHPTTAITACRYHRSSDLIALTCDDLSIRVVDIETRKLVRELWGCIGQIRDFCFSNDGRWIIAASMDSIIRVWDLPTGHLIDATKLEATCTALAFSVSGEFLATAHANSSGISLWTNRSLFMHVPNRQIDEGEILPMTLPTASGEGGQSMLAAAFDDEPVESDSEDVTPSKAVDQLSNEITTLSLVPRSRWQTLLHLDTIAARNKPLEPPKAPEKAPFFLPSVENSQRGASTSVQVAQDAVAVTPAERSRIGALQRFAPTSNPFTELLGTIDTNHEPFITHLKSLSPAAADIELRSLNPSASPNELTLFVKALTARLRERKDYEVIQAWMAVFLRIHGEVVEQDQRLIAALTEWRSVQKGEGERLGSLVGYCGGVVAFLRSAR